MIRFLLVSCLIVLSYSSYAYSKEDSIVLYESNNSRDSSDENKEHKPKFKLNIGAYHAYSKASILVQNGEQGTLLDPREDLNFEDAKFIPKVELIYEPSERHEIAFLFWLAKKNSNSNLEKDIHYKGILFPKNSKLETQLTITNYSLTYRYSLFKKEHWKAGISVGTKLVNFKSTLKAPSSSASNATLALGPMVGIHGNYTIGERIILKGTAEYFNIGINNWLYKTTDIKGGIEVYPFKNVGLGADYHYMNILFRKDKIEYRRNFDYRFNAFSLYFSFII